MQGVHRSGRFVPPLVSYTLSLSSRFTCLDTLLSFPSLTTREQCCFTAEHVACMQPPPTDGPTQPPNDKDIFWPLVAHPITLESAWGKGPQELLLSCPFTVNYCSSSEVWHFGRPGLQKYPKPITFVTEGGGGRRRARE